MDSHQLINAQFDRAVQIVQALPKTGPIQTDYEEKLQMYSLYKQATVGNVKAPRPGIFDMLGRAKWDAWAKHKDLDPYEAKWMYVEALLKVLRKYSDKTVAQDLVHELESYGGDPSNIISSRTLSRSANSDSSGSTASDDIPLPQQYNLRPSPVQHQLDSQYHNEESSDADSEDEEPPHPSATNLEPASTQALPRRPQSSLSSHRYRTPMAGSLAISPPPVHSNPIAIPDSQPLPGYEMPSAFAEPIHSSAPSSIYPATSSYVAQFSQSSRRTGFASPPPSHIHPSHPTYRSHTSSVPARPYGPARPASRLAIESTLDAVQSHITALSERLETLESLSYNPSRSRISMSPRGNISPYGRRSPDDNENHSDWDVNDMGLWSLVLNPVVRGVHLLKSLARFFARNEDQSPSAIILRRLCLDGSFLVFVLAIVRILWKRSGVRRQEVRAALTVLWHALIGTKKPRVMAEKGVYVR